MLRTRIVLASVILLPLAYSTASAQVVYELLCDPPHKSSYVAQSVMWRWDAISMLELDWDSPTPHNCLRVS